MVSNDRHPHAVGKGRLPRRHISVRAPLIVFTFIVGMISHVNHLHDVAPVCNSRDTNQYEYIHRYIMPGHRTPRTTQTPRQVYAGYVVGGSAVNHQVGFSPNRHVVVNIPHAVPVVYSHVSVNIHLGHS